MDTYKVVLTDKRTEEEATLEEGLTKEQAEKICEAWGWNYSDEHGKSFWMDFAKE